MLESRSMVLGGGCVGCGTPGLRSCRQISKISAFVDKSRIVFVVKEASTCLNTSTYNIQYIHCLKKMFSTGCSELGPLGGKTANVIEVCNFISSW